MALTNRLEQLNAERDQLMATVIDRVMTGRVRAARAGGDAALEYVLNDVCFEETKRLEATGGNADYWQKLAGQLDMMSNSDKEAALRELVTGFARDIVGIFNPTAYRVASKLIPGVFGFLLAPIHSLRDGAQALTSMDSRIHVRGELDVIRACAARGTLVVTPTHSSHLDSPSVGFGMQRAGLPPVTYGAGANLFSNPFMSYFLRNLGAYRVDRRLKFGLYKDVLKEYSSVLLEHGYHSLFFPGGTRNRSNVIEKHLKLGLLGTSLSAYERNLRAGRDARIYVVPATINYRLVLEAETLITDYLADTGKNRYIISDDESSELSRLVDFFRKIFTLEGAIVVRMGRPFDPFGNHIDANGESLDRAGRIVDPRTFLAGADGELTADPQRDAEYTRHLGRQLAQTYPTLTVFHSTAILARVIWDRVAKALGTRDVYRILRWQTAQPACSFTDACADAARWCDRIRATPAWGRLQTSAAGPADATTEDAIKGLSAYHTKKVVERRGDALYAGDMGLLYYYSNRLAHCGDAP